MKSMAQKASGVRVLHKTLNILETIKESASGLKLAELARAVDLPKATVYRILTTLEGRGYLDRREDGSYRLARKLFDLQRSVPMEQILSKAAQPVMEQLADFCKETVNLGVLDAGEVVVLNTVESPQAVRMSSKIGRRRHVHTTALGKALLAGMSDKELLRVIRLKRLPRLTPHTLANQTALLANLREVSKLGYALDNQENEIDGRCVGAPILGPEGRVVAAMSISAPVFRMSVGQAKSLVPKLKEASVAISEAIRSHGPTSSNATVPDGV
jgi:IclR family transcriptional regulator, KDG regulon repressor